MKYAVFVHEPNTQSGWDEIDRDCSADEACNLMRSWGSRGWLVMCVSVACIQDGWEMNYPTPG